MIRAPLLFALVIICSGCAVDSSPAATYQNHCAACHPGFGKGVGPALKPIALSDDQIRAKIRGTPRGTMPVFGPEKLSDEQVTEIITYIRQNQ